MGEVKVSLKQIGTCKFKATNSHGNQTVIDGPPDLGGNDEGVRPMEMILMGLAGCSAMDLLLILRKQRQSFDSLEVDVTGTRADVIPAVYSTIHLIFRVTGNPDPKKLERAASLSLEKYCSVAKMLQPNVAITWEAVIIGE